MSKKIVRTVRFSTERVSTFELTPENIARLVEYAPDLKDILTDIEVDECPETHLLEVFEVLDELGELVEHFDSDSGETDPDLEVVECCNCEVYESYCECCSGQCVRCSNA